MTSLSLKTFWFLFFPKAEMENWILFAEKLLLQWRVLTENNL